MKTVSRFEVQDVEQLITQNQTSTTPFAQVLGICISFNFIDNICMVRAVSYIPSDDEIPPMEGPYYREAIKKFYPIANLSYEKDFVIFTQQGQLVKVVKEIITSNRKIYQDCHLELAEE